MLKNPVVTLARKAGASLIKSTEKEEQVYWEVGQESFCFNKSYQYLQHLREPVRIQQVLMVLHFQSKHPQRLFQALEGFNLFF
jgi:hypothetical protein